MKIALLRTCNSAEYGVFCHEMFKELVSGKLEPFSPNQNPVEKLVEQNEEELVEVEEFNVQTERRYPEVSTLDRDYNALVVMGSVSNAYDDDEWILQLRDFIKHIFLNTRIKLIGICFGHQIIARALGGKVRKMPSGRNFGTRSLQFSEEAKRLLSLDHAALSFVHTHNDEVYELPPGAINVQKGSSNPYQSFALKDEQERVRVLTFQGHPEYLTPTGHKSLLITAEGLSKIEDQEVFLRSAAEAKVEDTRKLSELVRSFINLE